MNLREEARKVGGDKLVAQLDKAALLEKQLSKQVAALMTNAIEGLEGDEEKVALAACCEALSQAFANVAAVYTIKALDCDKTQGILTAVKSLTNSMNTAYADLETIEGDTLHKIMTAAKGSK